MEAVIISIIGQCIILLLWIILAKIEGDDEIYPTFLTGLLMIFIPFGGILLLLTYLYRNDKLRNK